MNFSGVYQRDKRNPSKMYHPMHNSVANYWTEAFQKNEIKHEFTDEYFLNNLHLIPDPLKKNLADTLFINETPKETKKEQKQDQKVPLPKMEKSKSESILPNTALSGIGTFFSGMISVLSNVMFRSRSPNYYDCFDDGHQESPSWQRAKPDVQDKNGKDRPSSGASPDLSSDMDIDRAAVSSCESKLNHVLNLLSPRRQDSSPVWVRKRPKKFFVEPGSVSESFEDAFSPEDFISLSNDTYVEYYSPAQCHFEDYSETAAQKTKLNMAPLEENTVRETNKSGLELQKDNDLSKEFKCDTMTELDRVSITENKKDQPDANETENTDLENTKHQLVSTCEDKLSKLKALLQEKRMKCIQPRDAILVTSESKTIPIEKKTADKRFKNPNRRCNKRTKSKMKCRIDDDLVFANELSIETPSSVENSPLQHGLSFGDYFDEVSGRFRSTSIGSEDSFQIVFNDSHSPRVRTTSDCDSEDSFIVFEDSPECCYTSNDVFCESDSDSDSDISDSGCGMVTCKLAHSLTRTVGNLADDSLYERSEDEVDFGNKIVNEPEHDVLAVSEEQKTGLLLDEKKKMMRKCQPPKKVQFSTAPPKVHVLRVWAFAARQARAGHWERFSIDRDRFKRRIADVDMALSWVLKPQHRSRVMFQRFMPWWNQLKRKELAEKQEKEAEEKRKEEERRVEKGDSRIEEEDSTVEEEKRIKEEECKVEDRLKPDCAIYNEDLPTEESNMQDEEQRKEEDNYQEIKLESAINEDLPSDVTTLEHIDEKSYVKIEIDKNKLETTDDIEFNNNKIIECGHTMNATQNVYEINEKELPIIEKDS